MVSEELVKEAIVQHLRKMLAGAPKSFKDKRLWRAYRQQALNSGDESLLAWPLRAATKKVVGPRRARKVDKFFWKTMSEPALKADMAAGKVLSKTPLVGKSLFNVKEKLPWGKDLYREVERPSALGPLIKARDIAEPILVGVGLEKGLKHVVGKKDRADAGSGGAMKQELREKVASVMLHLHEKCKEHEKRAHALRLLFKQAELGVTGLPQTFSEIEEKLASLVTEDLAVMEKALELTGGNVKLGELDRQDSTSSLNASDKFLADLLGNESF